jgi:hypothetical protein
MHGDSYSSEAKNALADARQHAMRSVAAVQASTRHRRGAIDHGGSQTKCTKVDQRCERHARVSPMSPVPDRR